MKLVIGDAATRESSHKTTDYVGLKRASFSNVVFNHSSLPVSRLNQRGRVLSQERGNFDDAIVAQRAPVAAFYIGKKDNRHPEQLGDITECLARLAAVLSEEVSKTLSHGMSPSCP